MSKFIVFFKQTSVEGDFLRGDIERQSCDHPIIAVPTAAIAMRIVARLNMLHACPEEAGGDFWTNFWFKSEEALTAVEWANAADLDDPKFPNVRGNPSTLEIYIADAKRVAEAASASLETEGNASNSIPPEPQSPLENLLRCVEDHRLNFLYWSNACRINPLALKSARQSPHERIDRTAIPGWDAMVDSIDDKGHFLRRHRDVLDRYAQRAMQEFGSGEGRRPSIPGLSKEHAEVAGGSLPFWQLDEDASVHLQRSTDAVLEVCTQPAAVDEDTFRTCAKEASSAAKPAGCNNWHEVSVVAWHYLSTLDKLLAKMKLARVNLSLQEPTEPPEEGVTPAATAPVPESPRGGECYVASGVLASQLRVRRRMLDRFLKEWRPAHQSNEWIEIPNPRPRQARFVYCPVAVRQAFDSRK